MIKAHLAKRLTLRRHPKIRLKAVRVEDRNKRLHGVQRGAGFRQIFGDVTTSAREHLVDGRNAVGGRLHFDVVHGF